MKRHLLIVLAVVFLSIGCSTHIHLDFLGQEKISEVDLVASKSRNKIVVIDLVGLIQTRVETGLLKRGGDIISNIYQRLQLAAADPEVKGIILRIDSPGGEGTTSDILCHEILEFKRITGKPVLAMMMGVAASGGYYVASACDFIIAHPTTITGSIGVIGILPNFEGVMSKIGLEMQVIKSGKMKDAGSPYRELTGSERQYFQAMIDEMYENFLKAVHRSRGSLLSMDRIRELADGRAYTAQQALELKLIDATGYFDSALQKIKSLAAINSARVIAYSYYPSSKTNIYALTPQPGNPLELGLESISRLLPGLKQGIYYLWLPPSAGDKQ